MSNPTIPTIDAAAQQANIWINELADMAHLEDRRQAYRLLRAGFHALRDWMNPDQAADFGAQLPTLLLGIYYEGWNPSATPIAERSRQQFVARVQEAFEHDPLRHPEMAIESFFALLNKHISAGQLNQMRNALQKPLRDLWPEAA